MTKRQIPFGVLIILMLFGLISAVNAQTSEYPQITDQYCDARMPCATTELECFSFPNIGLKCAEPNPCSYFKCPEKTQCLIAEIYPPSITCSCVGPECATSSGDEQTVSYDVATQTVVHTIDKNQQTVSHDITLKKSTSENRGILETKFTSVEHSNNLVVEKSKLLMQTSVGKKRINVMPETAIATSETPNNVEKIELKEELQKPIYSIRGKKRKRLLFIFPVNLNVTTKVSAETANVISIKKSWWSFLAW